MTKKKWFSENSFNVMKWPTMWMDVKNCVSAIKSNIIEGLWKAVQEIQAFITVEK